jgi:hypothetical protein
MGLCRGALAACKASSALLLKTALLKSQASTFTCRHCIAGDGLQCKATRICEQFCAGFQLLVLLASSMSGIKIGPSVYLDIT